MSDNENIKPFLKENARQPEGAGALEGSPAEQAADWIYHHVSYLDVVSFLKARKEGNAEQLLLSLMAEKEAPEELQAAAAANAAEVSERINQRLYDDMQPMRDALKNTARTMKIYAGVYSKIYQEIAEQVEVLLRPYRDALTRVSAYEKELERLEGVEELSERQRALYPFVREVLQEMPEGSRPDALEVVRDKTRKYSKIRKAAREKKQEYEDNQKAAEEIEKEVDLYLPVPTSQATEAFINGLSASSIKDIKAREEISHGLSIEVLGDKGKIRIVYAREENKCMVEVPDITKNNNAVNNLFIYSLIKLNEQAYSAGTLRNNYISFPLQEIVDIGMYKSTESARKGLRAAAVGLTSLKAMGEIRKDEKIKETIIQVLFTGANIKNNVCKIDLNPNINWGLIAAFYTMLPNYYFKLSRRGKDLLFYIFYIARQRTEQLNSKGKFNISMKAIAARLNLPKPEETKNPDRDIKSVIEGCITEIEDHNQNSNFTITPSTDSTVPIRKYYENEYITIELKKEFLEPFKKIKQKKKSNGEI